MFKNISNNRAQSVMGEYVLTFFLVVAFMTSMTLYLKRALQSYVREARLEMGDVIENRTFGFYRGNIITQYEPYYINSAASVDRRLSSSDGLLPSPGFATGIYSKTFDESTTTQSRSETLPPQLAD